MSEFQSEQLGAILDDIYDEFLTTVSEARGKTREVRGLEEREREEGRRGGRGREGEGRGRE
jgi:hypothetical protein